MEIHNRLAPTVDHPNNNQRKIHILGRYKQQIYQNPLLKISIELQIKVSLI